MDAKGERQGIQEGLLLETPIDREYYDLNF